MPSDKFSLNRQDWQTWGRNLVMFTAPILAVLFSLLANGVPIEKAYPVAILAAYGAIADLLKKWATTKQY